MFTIAESKREVCCSTQSLHPFLDSIIHWKHGFYYAFPIKKKLDHRKLAYSKIITLERENSAVACISEHAVIQHFLCHFNNVLGIEKKYFHGLIMHINKTLG